MPLPPTDPTPMSRRAALGRLAATAAATLATTTAGVAWLEPRFVRTSRHDLRVPGLDPRLDGVTIAQVTDMHQHDGVLTPGARRTLELLAAEPADLVVHTGDLWDSRHAEHEMAPLLAGLRGRLGTAAVPGNWEYSASRTLDRVRRPYEDAGIPLLDNRSVTLTLRGAPLTLAGLDDLRHGRPDAAAALASAPADAPVILLLHEPEGIQAVPPDPRLVAALAGHTHGGQVRLPLLPPFILPEGSGGFAAGWYRAGLPCPLYVSRGLGGYFPVRLHCPPELVRFTLRRA